MCYARNDCLRMRSIQRAKPGNEKAQKKLLVPQTAFVHQQRATGFCSSFGTKKFQAYARPTTFPAVHCVKPPNFSWIITRETVESFGEVLRVLCPREPTLTYGRVRFLFSLCGFELRAEYWKLYKLDVSQTCSQRPEYRRDRTQGLVRGNSMVQAGDIYQSCRLTRAHGGLQRLPRQPFPLMSGTGKHRT